MVAGKEKKYKIFFYFFIKILQIIKKDNALLSY